MNTHSPDIHPSLSQVQHVSGIDAQKFVDNKLKDYPYGHALAGVLIRFADPNRIGVVNFRRGGSLEGETGLIAQVDGIEPEKPAFMKMRAFQPESPDGWIKNAGLKMQRHGVLAIRPGVSETVLEGGFEEYITDYPQLAEVGFMDVVTIEGERRGQFHRDLTKVADLGRTGNLTSYIAESAYPWLLEFIMNFEAIRRTMDSQYPGYNKRQDIQELGLGSRYVIDLTNRTVNF